jgi:phosphotransacetylase
VIKAASDVVSRGLAKITLLGNPVSVAAEAKRLGTDISQCQIIDPKVTVLQEMTGHDTSRQAPKQIPLEGTHPWSAWHSRLL